MVFRSAWATLTNLTYSGTRSRKYIRLTVTHLARAIFDGRKRRRKKRGDLVVGDRQLKGAHASGGLSIPEPCGGAAFGEEAKRGGTTTDSRETNFTIELPVDLVTKRRVRAGVS